jgi:hypothetical protein
MQPLYARASLVWEFSSFLGITAEKRQSAMPHLHIVDSGKDLVPRVGPWFDTLDETDERRLCW